MYFKIIAFGQQKFECLTFIHKGMFTNLNFNSRRFNIF